MNLERTENDDPRYERAAAQAAAAGFAIDRNEYDVCVSVHHCATCGKRFTLCPPSATYGPDCTMDDCPSYDPARDASVYFTPDDPALIEGDRP